MHKHETPGEEPAEEVCSGGRNWRPLCLTVGVFSVLIILLLSYMAIAELNSIPVTEELDICTEPECFQASVEVASFMDSNVDPCDDFYSFSCGGYIQSSYDRPPNSPGLLQAEGVTNQLDAFVLKPIAQDDSQAVKMQKKFFQACMNTAKIDDDKDATFFALLNKLGGWPLLLESKWQDSDFNWVNITMTLRQLGLPFEWFLEIGVYQTDQNYLWLSYPQNCSDLVDIKLGIHFKFMIDIAMQFHKSKNTTIREYRQVQKFALELAEICDKSKRGKVQLNTIKELQNMFPKLKWHDFIKNITNKDDQELETMQIAHNMENYVRNMDGLMIRTPKKIQANYIIWRLFEYFAPFLSQPIRRHYLEYKRIHCHVLDRQEFCLRDTRSRFRFVSETEFIREHVSADVQKSVEEIVEHVVNNLKERVTKSWIDDYSKASYLDKLQSMEYAIGGDEEILDADIFDQYLLIGELNFTSDNAIDMLREKSLAHIGAVINSTNEPLINFSRTGLYDRYVAMEPFLEESSNILIVPASLLQQYTYNSWWPNYLNFAGLGVTIADVLARNFGNVEVSNSDNTTQVIGDWVDNIKLYYAGAVGCLFDDYAAINSRLPDRYITAQFYGDFAAVTIAYDAYNTWKQNREEVSLPGADFTPNELFWIKFSLNRCSKTWPHSEQDADIKYRVNGPLRNSHDFNEDFGCPPGAPMNPTKKCVVL